ncbi:ABC transporter permease [Pseudoxanthomonas winnipegensis]|nr:ABC transporter permease [Pseudoxanthomonas winnipegensis]
MIAYYFRLALRSLRRTPVMTALMVCAIGLGIGASMTMLTVLHVMTQDPIPAKSGALFYPTLDPLPSDWPAGKWGNPADNLTWPDTMALMRQGKPARQAVMAGGGLLVWPLDAAGRPTEHGGRYTTWQFFDLFGVPLEHGSGWTAADDERHARTVVLGHDLAMKLFGSTDVVGRSVRLKDTAFRVVGVAAKWSPQPRFYLDLSSGQSFGDTDDFFLPLSTAMELKYDVSGNQANWDDALPEDMQKSPSMSWLQMWVQLDTPQQIADYRRFLHDYAAQQHASGRFQRSPDTAKLYPLMDWLAYKKLVPSEVQLQLWLAIGFLLVCLVNIVALLLAKFLRRGGEIGVRRALGARASDIVLQLGCEAALVGVAGGLLGTALAQFGLWSVRQRPDGYARIAQMDAGLLIASVALAIVATLLAGLVPAWRASRISPALQIKAV